MSSDKVVNLRQARKARDKVQKRKKADMNAVKFGRTKAEQARDKAERERVERDLDGAKREE